MKTRTLKTTLMILFFILFNCTLGFAEITIGRYTQVKTKMINIFKYEYTYRAKLTNGEPTPIHATATLTGVPKSTTIIDGYLEFGEVGVDETVKSYDTFTISGSVLLPFYLSKLTWEVNSAPAYSDEDGDGVWDDYDLCKETALNETANRCGCSANDYLYRDYIDEDGFRYFTLNPLYKNPIVVKTLKENARIFENGFYITGTVFIKTESGDEIPMRDCDLYLEYGEEGKHSGLTRIRGTVSHPMPDSNLLEKMPLTYSFLVGWLKTARVSKAEIGMDLGENINEDLSIELPLQPDGCYLFFKYTCPIGTKEGEVIVDMVLDPKDPAFLFRTEYTGIYGISTTTFSFGISAKGQIPFKFQSWEDVGTPNETDSFFDKFSETFNLPDAGFDWLGTEFEGFKGFDDDLGFDAHLYYEGMQKFSAYPGEIHVDGAFYTNFDPDKDGVYPCDKNGPDYIIGVAGKMEVKLNLLDIGNIGLTSESNAMISVKDDEKALYFHGSLDQESELNIGLGSILPVKLSQTASIEASGLIDGKDHTRDFLRLRGDLELDFESAALSGIGIPEDKLTLLKSFGRVNGELRVNHEGIWLHGELQTGCTSTILSLESGAMVELFIDTNMINFTNESYLKLYGEFGVTVITPGVINGLPDGINNIRITSTGTPLVNTEAKFGLIIRQEGLFIGGKVDSNLSIHSAIDLGSSVEALLIIDFLNPNGTSIDLAGDMGAKIGGSTLGLSSDAQMHLGLSGVGVSGKTSFNFLDIKTVEFGVSGEISTNCGLSLSGQYVDELDLGFIVTNSTLFLSISTCADPKISIYSNAGISFFSPNCGVSLGGEFKVFTDSQPPRVELKLDGSNLAEDAINCIEDIAEGIVDVVEEIWGWLTGGGGGCILPGAMVRMADGTEKPVEDIKSGDSVMTTHGPRKVAVNDISTSVYPYEVIWNGSPTFVTIEHGFIWNDGSFVAYNPEACQSSMPGIDLIRGFPEEMKETVTSRPLTKEESKKVYNLILEWHGSDDAYNLGYFVNDRAVTDFIHPYCNISESVNPVARWVMDHQDEILEHIIADSDISLLKMEHNIIRYTDKIISERQIEIFEAPVNGEDGTELLQYLSTLPEADGLILWKVSTHLGRKLLKL